MTERYRLHSLGKQLTAAAVCLALLSGCGQAELGKNTEIASSQMDSALEQTGVSQAASPLEDETDSSDAPEQAAAATPVDALPEDLPEELTFCSGAGAWRTNLALTSDGSFTGQFTDWDAAVQYPGGLYRICTFSGTFSDLRQLDEHSYSMVLENLTCQETEGEEWVEDGTLYIGSTPYGLEGGTAFYLYRPEASTDVLTTESLQVEWPDWNLPETVPEGVLGCWMLYNADMDQGFFSYTYT